MEKVTVFQAARSSQGLPAFWEKRNNSRFLTTVELICDENFKPKKPIFLNDNPSIEKCFHVLFIARQGDIIIKAVRSNSSNTVRFYMHVVTEIKQSDDQKFSLVCEDIFNSQLIDDFVEKFGKEIEPFLDAAFNKLDSDVIDTFYSAPHNLHAIIKERRDASKK